MSLSIGSKTLLILLILLAAAALPSGWRGASPAGFTHVLKQSNIDFTHNFVDKETGSVWKLNQYDHGSGVLVADVNQDGRDDLYFLNFIGDNGLWVNRGDGTFEDVTQASGVARSTVISVGGAFGDYDNDGDPDLYVTSYRGGNRLFRNRGDGTFEDVTPGAGVGYSGHSSSATWFDYDNDGMLDLYVTNIGAFTIDTIDEQAGYYVGFRLPFPDMARTYDKNRGEKNLLFRNLGEGKFVEVAGEAGVATGGWNGDCAVADIDGDGWQDLYVTDMFGPDSLYRNRGNRSFEDVTGGIFERTSWGAVGARFFDANNDGRPDLYVVDMHSDMWMSLIWKGSLQKMEDATDRYTSNFATAKFPTPFGPKAGDRDIAGDLSKIPHPNVLYGNSFFLNRAGDRWQELSDRANLETFWPWAVVTGDLDDDGWQDIFVASGMGYPYYYWANQLFRNSSDTGFEEVGKKWGIEPVPGGRYLNREIQGTPMCRSSRSAAFLDYDGDGDLDIVVANFNHAPYLLQNNQSSGNHLNLKLVGRSINRDAVGTRVELFAGDLNQVQWVAGASGYLSQSTLNLHFGLGARKVVDRLVIHWSKEKKQTITEPDTDRLLVLHEPDG
jgi:hypothetical protein